MEITVSKNAGFCPGVRRADEGVMELVHARSKNSLIFTLGNLIHNRIYVESLESHGVKSIDLGDAERIVRENPDKEIFFVIRTHGIPKPDEEYLRNLTKLHSGVRILDMTCPYVKRIHDIAAKNTNDETCFLLYCDRNHPEAKGIMSYANGEKHAFSSLEELEALGKLSKVPILCSQTTQNLLEFEKIKKFLKKLYTNLIFFDTICNVTEIRQNEAILLAKESDAMIVLGGKDSSNTRKLYELCSAHCTDTFFAESSADLNNLDFLANKEKIGITAGASTPDDIILEVIKQWKKN